MNFRIIGNNQDVSMVRIEDKNILITDEQSALDIFMTIVYETGINRIIIEKDNLIEEFFELKNKIAGNIFQKVINYKIKLAIIGNFSNYDSKALKDFIYECNNGKDIFFVDDESTAISFLSKV